MPERHWKSGKIVPPVKRYEKTEPKGISIKDAWERIVSAHVKRYPHMKGTE